MEGKWVIRTYKSGRVIEKSKFWVPKQVQVRRGRVKGSTSAAKRDSNAKSAVRVLARILNCNCVGGDILLTVKFDDAHLPCDHKSADKAVENFMRRLKRAMKKLGREVRAVIVPSDMDGETGRSVRAHAHIVLMGSGIRFDEGKWLVGDKPLQEIWGNGSAYAEPLHDQADYTPLAVYLMRQARRGEDEKKWTRTRNLREPEIRESEARTGAALRQPARALLVEEGEYHAENGCHYIRYIEPEKKTGGKEQRNSDERETQELPRALRRTR